MFAAKNLIKTNAAETGIQFVGYATATSINGGSVSPSLTSLTGGISSSYAEDDLIILVGSGGYSGLNALNQDSGYSILHTTYYDVGGYSVGYLFQYKIAGVSESNPSISGNYSGEGVAAAVYVWRNVDTTTPFDVTEQTATGATSMKANPPSITPSTEGSFIVCSGHGVTNVSGNYTSSDLSSFVAIQADDTYNANLGIGYKEWASGAFDAAQFGFSGTDNTSACWQATSVALRPA